MATPVLITKLFVPQVRTTAVPRPRLIDRLNEGSQRKLTLVSAPAGFGKTTLISEWIAVSDRSTAWISLDEGDGDVNRFLTYVVMALQRLAPEVGQGVLSLLQTPQPPPIESVLTTLLNEIATLPIKVNLILDDYHAIDSQGVDNALAFLLDHLPEQLQITITTREDPQLPLARLRARGQLSELRAADLRFTPVEAAAFLNSTMGLDLSPEHIEALEQRTEGWIAGLQLAAISLQGQPDAAGFIESFTGSHRFVMDYLIDEVLHQQPENVQAFLVQTSILDRMCGSLCEAVTENSTESAQDVLELIERANLFLVPLDNERRWYRYHHLFAELLRKRLHSSPMINEVALHGRASVWHEHHGLVDDAVRHAVIAKDFARAAELMEQALPALARDRLGVKLLGWLRSVPDEAIRARPVLNVAYGWALMSGGEFDKVEARLQNAESYLEQFPQAAGNDDEFPSLPGTIAVYRAAHAQVTGDVPLTAKYAQRALDLVPVNDHLSRGAAAALLGLASWSMGELDAAHRNYAAGMASLHLAGHLSDVVTGAVTIAEIRSTQGRIRDAEQALELALRQASEQGGRSALGMPDLLVRLSEIRRERNDLSGAIGHLLRARELATNSGAPYDRSRWCVAMARINEAQGDLDGALLLFDEADQLFVGGFSPNVRPVAAQRTQLWLAQGSLSDALEWVREHSLSPEDELTYLREFEHLTLAKVLVALHKANRNESRLVEAIGLLERLLAAAVDFGRKGSVIELLVQLALAHQARGDVDSGLAYLERALVLAEAEGYVRIFIDEGSAMADLLSIATARGMHPEYTGRLLASFTSGTLIVNPPVTQALDDPLSSRELEVLQLIALGLSNDEIAERLFLALSTVKGHNREIFGKLSVQRRTEAVARARSLGVL